MNKEEDVDLHVLEAYAESLDNMINQQTISPLVDLVLDMHVYRASIKKKNMYMDTRTKQHTISPLVDLALNLHVYHGTTIMRARK